MILEVIIAPDLLVMIPFLLFAIASFVLTVWSAIEIATKPFRRDKDKVIWLIIVLLLSGIGPIIYLFFRKSLLKKYDTTPREYLPDLPDERARPQVQTGGWEEQDQYV